MLVLSRKVGERIHVGDDVVLEIRRIAGNRVTLALDAPRHVRILRGELDKPYWGELQRFVADPAMAAEGAATYKTVCAACHGNEGQGLIGPNLTDAYWLHGGTNMDIYHVISDGVVAKGMPPWEAVYSSEERAQIVAFVRSLEGTNPPNAKEAEGELVE